MKKIAILGASGFIGQALLKRMVGKNGPQYERLTLCTRNKVKFDQTISALKKDTKISVAECDHTVLKDIQSLLLNHDLIVSLAGLAWQHPGGKPIPADDLLTQQIIQNCVSALVLGKLLKKDQRLIWTSTSAVDGMLARLSKKNKQLLKKEVASIADKLLSFSVDLLQDRNKIEKTIADLVKKSAFLSLPQQPYSRDTVEYAKVFSYAYSKFIGQTILEKLSNKNITILKISDVYGPGQDISEKVLDTQYPARRIQRFLTAYREIANGNIDWISDTGSTFGFTKKDGKITQNVWNDWIFPSHVDDVCKMIIESIKKNPGKTTLNVNGNRLTNKMLVKKLTDHFNVKITIHFDKKPTFEMTQNSTDLPYLNMSTKSLKSFDDGFVEWLKQEKK